MINTAISKYRAIKYSLVEPVLLARMRSRFAKDYKKSDRPLVSIIIATYNRADILIDRTIPSLLSQTYNNIEVVIVGDSCIDDTAVRLKNFPDPRVRFHDLPVRGKYPANIKDRWFVQGTKPRNEGMKIANGQWFAFISDDDILLPNCIEILLRAAQERDLEFISASYEAVRRGEKVIIEPSVFDESKPDLKIGGMQTWLYRSYLKVFEWNIEAWRKSYNRPVDYDLQNRFFEAGVAMGSIKDVVAIIPAVEGTNTTGYEAAKLAEQVFA
jgi:glycosyltransferase involved in cell wall biosynthesis